MQRVLQVFYVLVEIKISKNSFVFFAKEVCFEKSFLETN